MKSNTNTAREAARHAQEISEAVADARTALVWLLGDGAEDAAEWQVSVAKLCRMLSEIERHADSIRTGAGEP